MGVNLVGDRFSKFPIVLGTGKTNKKLRKTGIFTQN